MKNVWNKLLENLSPLLLGMLAFYIIIGLRVLDPTNLAWLGEGDPATHYLGWLFFGTPNGLFLSG